MGPKGEPSYVQSTNVTKAPENTETTLGTTSQEHNRWIRFSFIHIVPSYDKQLLRLNQKEKAGSECAAFIMPDTRFQSAQLRRIWVKRVIIINLYNLCLPWAKLCYSNVRLHESWLHCWWCDSTNAYVIRFFFSPSFYQTLSKLINIESLLASFPQDSLLQYIWRVFWASRHGETDFTSKAPSWRFPQHGFSTYQQHCGRFGVH